MQHTKIFLPFFFTILSILNASDIHLFSSFPQAKNYNELLPKTPQIQKTYLQAGLYSENEQKQRDEIAKKIIHHLAEIGEKPIVLIESHDHSSERKRNYFSFLLLTDQALYSQNWVISSDSNALGSINNDKRILLSAHEITTYNQLYNKIKKLTGTFAGAPYVYSNKTVLYITIWQKKAYHTFAVPYLRVFQDGKHYPWQEDYKPVAILNTLMKEKLNTLLSDEEEQINSLLNKIYDPQNTKELPTIRE